VKQSPNTDFITRWLNDLPEAEIEREIHDLSDQINELAARLNTLREAIELKRRFEMYMAPQIKQDDAGGAGDDEQPAPRESSADKPGSIREGVLAVMESNPARAEWSLPAIYKSLVEREWLEDSNQAMRSLGAALSRMTTEGEIARVRRGVYKRAAKSAALQELLELGGESG
jgi:hypothetical protein